MTAVEPTAAWMWRYLDAGQIRQLARAWRGVPSETRGWALMAAHHAFDGAALRPLLLEAAPAPDSLMARLRRRWQQLIVPAADQIAALLAISQATYAGNLGERLTPRQFETLYAPFATVVAQRGVRLPAADDALPGPNREGETR